MLTALQGVLQKINSKVRKLRR